jgi:hypothetical protein
MKRLYTAGPMSGISQMNFPAFDALAYRLRKAGYEVISPAELDDPKSRLAALASLDGNLNISHPGVSWGMFLARDVELIADDGIEAVVVLPGWEKSRGARLETFVANALCGLPIFTVGQSWGHLTLHPVPYLTLVRAWAANDDIVLNHEYGRSHLEAVR